MSLLPDSPKIKFFLKRITKYGLKRVNAYPWRRESDPYKTFIAEMLLQRTKVRQVLPVYEEFIKRFPTINSLASAKIEDIASIISPLGLAYRAERLKR